MNPVYPTRRAILSMIGATAGATAMYAAMTSLGHAAESYYNGPVRLEGDPKGAKVLILGAGLAGMTAALELRKAGYQVEILEYREKAGGRCWTLHAGDSFTELGGATQHEVAQRLDQARAFGNRHEAGRWNLAKPRMAPADQRLGAHRGSAVTAEQRLEGDPQLVVALHRLAQLRHQPARRRPHRDAAGRLPAA